MLLVGALLVGNSFYVSVTTGSREFLSVAVIGQLVVGLVAIAVGYRYQLDADDLTRPSPDTAADSTGEPTDDDEFDPALSPVGETLEHVSEDTPDESASNSR